MLKSYREFAMVRGLLEDAAGGPATPAGIDPQAMANLLYKVADDLNEQIDKEFALAQAQITGHVRMSMRNNQGVLNKLKNWWQVTWHGKDREKIESVDPGNIRLELPGLLSLYEHEILSELMQIMESGPINQALAQMVPMLESLKQTIKVRIFTAITNVAKNMTKMAPPSRDPYDDLAAAARAGAGAGSPVGTGGTAGAPAGATVPPTDLDAAMARGRRRGPAATGKPGRKKAPKLSLGPDETPPDSTTPTAGAPPESDDTMATPPTDSPNPDDDKDATTPPPPDNSPPDEDKEDHSPTHDEGEGEDEEDQSSHDEDEFEDDDTPNPDELSSHGYDPNEDKEEDKDDEEDEFTARLKEIERRRQARREARGNDHSPLPPPPPTEPKKPEEKEFPEPAMPTGEDISNAHYTHKPNKDWPNRLEATMEWFKEKGIPNPGIEALGQKLIKRGKEKDRANFYYFLMRLIRKPSNKHADELLAMPNLAQRIVQIGKHIKDATDMGRLADLVGPEELQGDLDDESFWAGLKYLLAYHAKRPDAFVDDPKELLEKPKKRSDAIMAEEDPPNESISALKNFYRERLRDVSSSTKLSRAKFSILVHLPISEQVRIYRRMLGRG